MTYFQSLNIRHIVRALLLVAVLLLIAQSAFLISTSQNTENFVLQYQNTSKTMVQDAYKLKSAIIQVQQWLTDISATRGLNGLNDGFEKAAESATHAKNILAEMSQLDAQNANEYDQIQQTLDQYYNAGLIMAKAYIAKGPSGGNPLMSDFDKTAETMQSAIDEMILRIDTTNDQELALIVANSHQSKLYNMIACSIMGLGLLVFFFLIKFRILKPICQVNSMMNNIANGEVDLTQRLPVNNADEIGQMAQGFNLFADKLQKMLKKVADASTPLDHASNELTQITKATSEGMLHQQNQTTEAATAITEMASTVQEVAANAENAAKSAQDADTAAQQALTIVGLNATSIEELTKDVNGSAEIIQQLAEKSQSIGSVLDVIKGIAEQTNLLALNAAIEAARAGEQGRGFAVVADEVRNLASRTQESTEEIEGMIATLQNQASNAVNAMGESQKKSEASMQRSHEVADSLSHVAKAIREITDMNIQIAASAEEQSTVAEEINRNIVNINEVANKTADDSLLIDSNSQKLAKLAGDIRGIVGEYRF